MRTTLLLITLLFCGISVHATEHVIVTPGFSFSPSTLTIQQGDTVVFDIDGSHNAVEVSQATWNANGSTPLNGGFSLDFGGGTLLPAQLPVGTHFYVCQPHSGAGMKGMIIVEPSTSVKPAPEPFTVDVTPNPSTGMVYLQLDNAVGSESGTIVLYAASGTEVYRQRHALTQHTATLNLAHLPKGNYVIRVQTSEGIVTRQIVLQ